jgi:heme-degrading monooxygenase HmoA
MWRGWTGHEGADEVAAHLRDTVVDRFATTPGNVSAQLLRRPTAGGVELMTLSVWESARAVPPGVDERHRLLVARETIAACWEIVGAQSVVAAAA